MSLSVAPSSSTLPHAPLTTGALPVPQVQVLSGPVRSLPAAVATRAGMVLRAELAFGAKLPLAGGRTAQVWTSVANRVEGEQSRLIVYADFHAKDGEAVRAAVRQTLQRAGVGVDVGAIVIARLPRSPSVEGAFAYLRRFVAKDVATNARSVFAGANLALGVSSSGWHITVTADRRFGLHPNGALQRALHDAKLPRVSIHSDFTSSAQARPGSTP